MSKNQIKIYPLKKSSEYSISIPGSKSVTNRALLMAAISKDEVLIKNYLKSDDTDAMISCLKNLGVKINQENNNLIIKGNISDIKNEEYILNANLSGTTIRFITALSCIVSGMKTIKGEGHLNKRPIGDLVNSLKSLGARIEYLDKSGFPPVFVSGKINSSNKKVKVSGRISSQFLTAILMIAPVFTEGLEIEIDDDLVSKSYIDLTVSMMKEFGIKIENFDYKKIIVKKSEYKKGKYIVEGDYSAASYFAAISVLTGSKMTLKNLKKDTRQGDKQFFEILEKMGNHIDYKENEVFIFGNKIKHGTYDMEACPDQAQTLAVLLAFAKGRSVLKGVRSLRVKETERVKALQNELKKMSVKTESPDEDTLVIYGGNPKPAIINTYNDHRMAMSFAIFGTKIGGVGIKDPDVVKKTFPDFWDELGKITNYKLDI